MGYRSDVAYTIRFNAEDDKVNEQSFFIFLAEAKARDECALALQEVKIHAGDDPTRLWQINFRADNIKWYETYPEIASHNKLIALAEEWIDAYDRRNETPDMYCVFMRVGENDDDIETYRHGNYDNVTVYLVRKIETDFDDDFPA